MNASNLFWWVFYFVGHVYRYSTNDTWLDAMLVAIREINTVLKAHNDAVVTAKCNDGFYWVNTHNMSDNQCALLGSLNKQTFYREIDPRSILYREHDGRSIKG